MKITTSLLCALLFLRSSASLKNTTTVSGPVDLSPMLQQVVEDYGLIGVTAFAASSTGTCALGSAGTLAISKPNSPIDLFNSPWKSGSLAKGMTASLAALLVRDGLIQYNSTLGDIFPDDAPGTAYESVTLEDLLGHRGGFQRDWYAVHNLLAAGTQLVFLTDLADHDMPLVEQRRVLIQYALTLTNPVTTPRTTHLYSNMGYAIAAIMLETATGIAYEDLMKERLFDPLGLASAHFGCVDHLPQYAPLGHATDPGQGLIPVASASLCDCIAPKVFGCDCLNEAITEGIPLATYGGGIFPFFYAQVAGADGINMQLSDWVRYYQWHLAGELGLDTSGLLSQQEFQRLHTGTGGEITDDEEIGRPYFYGHGWIVEEPIQDPNSPFYDLDLGPMLWHTGTNRLWTSIVVMFPEVDRMYFIATNSDETRELNSLDEAVIAIRDAMLLDGYENAPCPAIDSLDSDRDPGKHETCPVLVYGELYEEVAVEEDDMPVDEQDPTNVAQQIVPEEPSVNPEPPVLESNAAAQKRIYIFGRTTVFIWLTLFACFL